VELKTLPLRRILGPAAIIIAAVTLGACTTTGDVTTIGATDCKRISKKAQAKINWARVPSIDVRVRNDEFEPMILRLRQGRPYILRIRNRDDGPHTFRAARFLQQNAIMTVAINGKRLEENCVRSVSIPGRQTAEIRMVAVVDGHYEFEDNVLLFPWVFSSGPSGIIIVEERVQTAGG